jgi:predicted ATPase
VAVERLWVQNYRSLLDVAVPLGRCTIVQGVNATGKTNLYRALQTIRHAAIGDLRRAVLDDGGLPSILWAGVPRSTGKQRKPVRITFGVETGGVCYEMNLGRPQVGSNSPFSLDAEIKEERAWIGAKHTRSTSLLDRSGTTATATDADGAAATFAMVLDPAESALSQLGEPARFPELYELRDRIARWRFYHHFPTEPGAPARAPQPGVRTPVLADDGHDLAAALVTVRDMGSGPALDDAIRSAFGARAELVLTADQGRFDLALTFVPGVQRPMAARELSDGTLRFLYLVAALLTPRPPELLVLNEPETSLHPGLLAPLAELVAGAARFAQVVVTTHSEELAVAIASASGERPVVVERDDAGATRVVHGGR